MKKLAGLMLVLLGGMTFVRGQQPARLTVREALDLADKQNLELAEAAASDRGRLASMLATRHRELSVPGADHALEQLLNLTRRIGDVGRDDMLLRFLLDLEKGRWVAFYSSAPRCSQLARLFSNHWGGQTFVVTVDTEEDEAVRTIARPEGRRARPAVGARGGRISPQALR